MRCNAPQMGAVMQSHERMRAGAAVVGGSHIPEVLPVYAGDADLGLKCRHEGGNIRLEALLLSQYQIASHCCCRPYLHSHIACHTSPQ